MKMDSTLDLSKIECPKIEVTNEAQSQILLMSENDPSLEGKSLRLLINGKGCAGFDYASGFDFPRADDFIVALSGFSLLLDPFSAFYLNGATLDYVQDFAQNREGFVIINPSQDKFQGKFWKKNHDLVPELKSSL